MKNMTSINWDKRTAKIYDYYSEKYPLYKKTSQFLIKQANIKRGMTIVDLACGTGITIKEILKKVGNSGKVIGIDSSHAMIDIAKKKINRNNVVFICSSAEQIDRVIQTKVDLIVCNSAFWQMNMNKVLKGIRKILKDDGKFIFNISGQYYKFPVKFGQFRGISLLKVMKEITISESGMKQKNKRKRIIYDFETINKILENNSFRIKSHEIFEMPSTLKDQYEFCKIPVMTTRIFPKMSYSKRIKILKEAYKRLNKASKSMSKYIYFITEKSRS